jgi:hypothetical protein
MLTEKSHYIADMQEYNDKIMNIFCLHFRKIKIRWNSMVSRDSWQKLTQNGWKIRFMSTIETQRHRGRKP